MTEQKARKRAIRARMTKTGERYTAARRNVTKSEPKLLPRIAEPTHSEEAVHKATGKGWDHWFRILDRWEAVDRPHKEIAQYLIEKQGVPGWWAQAVTVSYERARGLRAANQAKGGYQVNVSKTIPVSIERVFRAVVKPGRRDPWIEPGTLKVRTSTEPKSARFDFKDGSSRVMVWFESKGQAKTTVGIMHERLKDAKSVEEMRAFWKERLARLAAKLT
jgi:uncharacterized protein YndB with AHSA1/START domain